MMDIKDLIKRLNQYSQSLIAYKLGADFADACMDAADALEKLQAENKRLNKIVCSIPTTPDSGRTVSQYDKEMSMCAYLDDLEAENEKLRAELGKAKIERDMAAEDLLDAAIIPCLYCERNPSNGGACDMDNDNHEMFSCWKWRGIQKED